MCKEGTFLIHTIFYQPVKHFSNDMLGRLFRALFENQINGETTCDSDIQIAFDFFVSQFEEKEEIIMEKPHKSTRKPVVKIESQFIEAVETIYKVYPSRCPNRGSSTSKGIKEKTKISQLMQTHSEKQLIEAINNYVTDCRNSGTYLKNFATFLNNLPDLDSSQISPIQEDNRKLKWHIRPTGKTRESSKEQFELDKERFGEENIDFLGYAV